MRWMVGLVVMVAACSGDDGNGSGSEAASESESSSVGSESESGSTESGPETGSSSIGETSTESGSTSETESGTTGGDALSCAEATDAPTCEAAGGDYSSCAWLTSSTWVVNGDACESIDVGRSGTCVVAEQADDCSGPPEVTCPDGITAVFYRVVGLEVGAIEVVALESDTACESPSGDFTPCAYADGVFDPPECACGCPQ
jgi:hypothetical protein